jgi:hypothetical protein
MASAVEVVEHWMCIPQKAKPNTAQLAACSPKRRRVIRSRGMAVATPATRLTTRPAWSKDGHSHSASARR